MELRARTMSGTPYSCLKIATEFQSGDAKDKNFIFSPWAMQLALGLIANGSTGSTKKELLKFLDSPGNLNLLNVTNEYYLNSYQESHQGDPLVKFVGNFWVDDTLTLKPSFKARAESYKAKVKTVNLREKLKKKAVVEEVKQWAEEATPELIKPAPSRNAFTRIVLANALRFSGRWEDEFGKRATKDGIFYLLDGQSVDVPFMTCKKDRPVKEFEGFKVLRLPYTNEGGRNMSMYIILPNARDGLASLVEKMGSDPLFLQKYLSSRQEAVEVGDLKIPKFKMSYELEASEVLKSIGLKEFDEMVLNLMPGEDDRLRVLKIGQKSYIEIDEEGTKAAAFIDIECGIMGFDMFGRPIPVDFVADHPFMFLIRDDDSGMVLFMGHVVNPLLE